MSLGFHTTPLPWKRKRNRSAKGHVHVNVLPFIVYHDGGSVGEVAGDGGEVEGGDGGDESLEGAVPHQVEGGLGVLRDGLVAEELLAEVAVEAEEVNQLGGRVDLGLKE